MIKRIKLESKSGRLLDREPFLMAENEKLNIELETEHNAILLMSMKNGNMTARISTTGKFEVPTEVVFRGRLEMVVSLYVGNELSQQWTVEPIVIVDHNEAFAGFLEFDEILKRLDTVTELAAKVAELTEKCAELEKQVAEVAEIVNDPLN